MKVYIVAMDGFHNTVDVEVGDTVRDVLPRLTVRAELRDDALAGFGRAVCDACRGLCRRTLRSYLVLVRCYSTTTCLALCQFQ